MVLPGFPAYRSGPTLDKMMNDRKHLTSREIGRLMAALPLAVHPHMLRHACGFALAVTCVAFHVNLDNMLKLRREIFSRR